MDGAGVEGEIGSQKVLVVSGSRYDALFNFPLNTPEAQIIALVMVWSPQHCRLHSVHHYNENWLKRSNISYFAHYHHTGHTLCNDFKDSCHSSNR